MGSRRKNLIEPGDRRPVHLRPIHHIAQAVHDPDTGTIYDRTLCGSRVADHGLLTADYREGRNLVGVDQIHWCKECLVHVVEDELGRDDGADSSS